MLAVEEALPRSFGRYRLTGILGHGGMASVYRAESEPVAGVVRTVAIKQMLQRGAGVETDLQALVDEARIWVRLHHPNIVDVVDFGEVGGDLFLALELVDGLAASSVVLRASPLSPAEALLVVERVARALAYAHALRDDAGKPLQVIHRDVKPANILLSRDGEVKLTDFGIARATIRDSQTQAGFVKGSIGFLSPEQVRGEDLDGRSDLYSLGCTLYALVTGRIPLPAGNSREAVLEKIAKGETLPPPDFLAPRLRELLSSLMGPTPGDRPSTADDVVKRVRTLLEDDADDLQRMLGERVQRAVASPAAPPAVAVAPGDAAAPITQTIPPMPAVAAPPPPAPLPPARVPPSSEATAKVPAPPVPVLVSSLQDSAATDLLPARVPVAAETPTGPAPETGSTPGPAVEPLFPAVKQRFWLPRFELPPGVRGEAILAGLVVVGVITGAVFLGRVVGGGGLFASPTPYPSATPKPIQTIAATPAPSPSLVAAATALPETTAQPAPSATAARVAPGDPRATQALASARAFAKGGKYERAIEILYLEALRDHAPGVSEDLHFHVCLYSSKLHGLSNKEAIRGRYDRYLQRFPNAPRAGEVRAWSKALEKF